MAHRLKSLIINRVDLVDAGANPKSDIAIFKRETTNQVTKEECVPEEPVDATVVEPTPEPTPEPIPEPVIEPEPTPEPVAKSLPDEIVQRLEKAEQIERELIALRRDVELAELAKRAEAEYATLPGTPIAKAAVLKAMATLIPETATVLETMLKAGEAAMKLALTEKGQTAPTELSITDRVQQLAKQRVDAGESKSLAQAMEAVFKSHPGLYDEYVADAKARR